MAAHAATRILASDVRELLQGAKNRAANLGPGAFRLYQRNPAYRADPVLVEMAAAADAYRSLAKSLADLLEHHERRRSPEQGD